MFSAQAFIGAAIPTGVKYLVGQVTDSQDRSANIPITLTVESPTCGVEYWNVKTGTDADAATINLNNVIQTTVNDLRAIPIPFPPIGDRPRGADGQSATRIPSTEFTVFQVAGTLTFYKLETDVDYHMVLQDAAGNTIIGEVPSPACVGAGSPFAAGVANARAKVDARLTPADGFQSANLPVQMKGRRVLRHPSRANRSRAERNRAASIARRQFHEADRDDADLGVEPFTVRTAGFHYGDGQQRRHSDAYRSSDAARRGQRDRNREPRSERHGYVYDLDFVRRIAYADREAIRVTARPRRARPRR